jgi:hypothetical protein
MSRAIGGSALRSLTKVNTTSWVASCARLADFNMTTKEPSTVPEADTGFATVRVTWDVDPWLTDTHPDGRPVKV